MYDDYPDDEKPKRGNHVLAIAAIVVFSIIFWSASRTGPNDLGWPTDFAQAKARAAAEHKPILVLFSASWCPPCQKMKQYTWPDPKLKDLVASRFVPVYLDVDRHEIATIAQQFGVSGIPHVNVADSNGKPLENASVVGFRSASEMLGFLGRYAAN